MPTCISILVISERARSHDQLVAGAQMADPRLESRVPAHDHPIPGHANRRAICSGPEPVEQGSSLRLSTCTCALIYFCLSLDKLTDNPMQPEILALAPRCGAKTRSGSPCRSPAVRGRARCRMHGGTNRGAPRGNRNAHVHGNRTSEAEQQLRTVRAINRDLRIFAKVEDGDRLRCSEQERLLRIWLKMRGDPLGEG